MCKTVSEFGVEVNPEAVDKSVKDKIITNKNWQYHDFSRELTPKHTVVVLAESPVQNHIKATTYSNSIYSSCANTHEHYTHSSLLFRHIIL